jgi:aminomethyltransferase
MVDFAGWALPVQYTSIIAEHQATRTGAGIFDVCHMGEVEVAGGQALDLLQWIMTRDLSGLQPGRMKLSVMTREDGGIIDDVTIYCLGPARYLVVTNAGTARKDFLWLEENRRRRSLADCAVTDVGAATAKIDLQGPRAEEILRDLTAADVAGLRHFFFLTAAVAGVDVLVSRSGYTGEDGFEIYLAAAAAEPVWDALLARGGPLGLRPAGLGARDTLRLEAGLVLYGHDLDETTSPAEVRYGWLVDMSKDFCGRAALLERERDRAGRRLAGFVMEGREIARSGYAVSKDGAEIGRVTSGSYAPTLARPIGYALIPAAYAAPGTEVVIDVRGRPGKARIVNLPFYRRPLPAAAP